MKNLRKKFDIFCLRNRDKGIPNLMLYIVIGCGAVTVFDLLGYSEIYELLQFDREKILQGQIWRLFSYVFTVYGGSIITALIVLYCAYSLGSAVERLWGTCKFNLFYLTTILLMDLYAMIFDGSTLVCVFESGVVQGVSSSLPSFYASCMPMILHLSVTICFATLYPDAQFLVFFIIPIKAKVLSLIYLGYLLFLVVAYTVPVAYLPHNLFPLFAMIPYFLFFGKDVLNLLPLSWQVRKKRKAKTKKTSVKGEPIPFRSAQQSRKDSGYNHRCTVCGRTDVSNPELEFRYCSRCTGYYCYCQDHISNHTHIE